MVPVGDGDGSFLPSIEKDTVSLSRLRAMRLKQNSKNMKIKVFFKFVHLSAS